MVPDQLTRYALQQAEACVRGSRFAEAVEWLDKVDRNSRPVELTLDALAGAVRLAASKGDWAVQIGLLRRALSIREDDLMRKRLLAVERRRAMMPDDQWEGSLRTVPPSHLALDALPGVDEVRACGAFYAWRGGSPWSTLIRAAKHASPDLPGGRRLLETACAFLCRFVLERTSLLRRIDAVIAIPARPLRFVERMMSLPDELAAAVETQLGVPFLKEALVSTSDDLELRGMNRRERSAAVRGSMAIGRLPGMQGRTALLVDDVITSGSTIVEAARLLRAADIGAVCAVALAHTEG